MKEPPDTHKESPENPLNWHAFISLGSTGSSGLLVLILGLSDTCRQQWTCMECVDVHRKSFNQ